MKVSDFVGQKIVEIIKNDDLTLIIFENRGRVFFQDSKSAFFSGDGVEADIDISDTPFMEMFRALEDE